MKTQVAVVDDDEADRYIVRRALQELDAELELIEFEAGDEFVATIKDPSARAAALGEPGNQTLVLLDINMPRMNGFEVMDSLGDLLAEERVFVVTMYSSSNHANDRSDALQYQFVKDYIVKPITPDVLEDLIRRHFGSE